MMIQSPLYMKVGGLSEDSNGNYTDTRMQELWEVYQAAQYKQQTKIELNILNDIMTNAIDHSKNSLEVTDSDIAETVKYFISERS